MREAAAELHAKLQLAVERSLSIRGVCANEDSTKLYLILPILRVLGYDTDDPYVVQPEFPADFHAEMLERVDYAIMRDQQPLIAVECKRAGTELPPHRGQLRSYFTALPSVRLGILTDGLKFEFFADCEAPNIMDDDPFLSLAIEKLPTADNIEAMELLLALSSDRYSPDHVLELAETRFLAERVRSALLQEMRHPSEELCRHVLQKVGLKNLRKSSIQSRYAPVIQKGFEQAIIVPVIRLLQQGVADREGDGSGAEMRIVTTDRESAVYNYIRRRLAYLARDEREYSAIERVKFKDYQGKFAIYYENVRKGRLLDFVEGSNGYDRFAFPAPIGEVVTNSMMDLDEPLRRIFRMRLQESSGPVQSNLRVVG